MASTINYDPAFKVWALQTRTDESGVDVEDNDATEGRMPWRLYTGGILDADHYQVVASGASMTVDVGSGTAFEDLAIVEGLTAAAGNYGVLLGVASLELTVPAADLTNPRLDEVYLEITDDPGTMVKARIDYRVGDAASSPVSPGPDAAWDGYLLVASILVPAGATAFSQGDVTDERPLMQSLAGAVGSSTGDASSVTTSGNMPASFTTIHSVAFVMPSGWSAARIVAHGDTWALPSGGVTQVRMRVGGVSGTARGPYSGSSGQKPSAMQSREVTGDATIELQIQGQAGSGGTWDHPAIEYVAHRTA